MAFYNSSNPTFPLEIQDIKYFLNDDIKIIKYTIKNISDKSVLLNHMKSRLVYVKDSVVKKIYGISSVNFDKPIEIKTEQSLDISFSFSLSKEFSNQLKTKNDFKNNLGHSIRILPRIGKE